MLIGSLLTTIVYVMLISVWLVVCCNKKKTNGVSLTAAPNVKNHFTPNVQKTTANKNNQNVADKPTTIIQAAIASKPLEDKTIVKLKSVEIKDPVKSGPKDVQEQQKVEEVKTSKEKEVCRLMDCR
ncbi:hypothetical protein M3Y95_00879300 [Aphelenchoides besseyi]|nr:hypothetical protein M3Y95_00879300 [Aphelenchoides besseyi]